MASVHYLYSDAYYIARHIIKKHSHLEQDGKTRYFAAVIIQRLWRGYCARKMIEGWHNAATVIQKHVRGWLLRWHLPDIYKQYLQWRTWNYYNRMATRIQSTWKGYYVRKYVACIKDILEQRRRMEQANAEMRQRIREAFENMEKERAKAKEKEAKQWVLYILFKIHHVLRTYMREGVYSLHGKKHLSEIEELIKAISYKPYMKELKKEYEKVYNECTKPKPYFSQSKKFKEMEETYRMRDRTYETNVTFFKDLNISTTPFKLSQKIDTQLYERMLMCIEKYVPPINSLKRSIDKSKHISETDFNLNILKTFDFKPKVPPYYSDLWKKHCPIHDVTQICSHNKIKK